MTSLTIRLSLVVLGLSFACSAHSQFGGGGRGGATQGGGIFGSNTGTQRETSFDGAWFLEFELEFDSNNPEDTGERVTIRADVTVIGVEVNGRLRRPAEGEFTCTIINGPDRCDSGRLLIVWPDKNEREAASFEFVVDQIDNRRGKGEAIFTNNSDGAVRIYSVAMRKR